MFKLKDKETVLDGLNRVVGMVVKGRFTQKGVTLTIPVD